MQSGDLEGAISILESFRQQTPPDLEALSLLAALYLEVGRPEATLEMLAPLIDAGTDPRTLFHAARAALALGKLEQGERYLVAAVDKAPTSFAALRLAELRAVQERPLEVIELLAPLGEGPLASQVRDQDPDLAARIAWLFATALIDTDQPGRAVEPLERLSALAPDDHKVWKLYGETLIELDRIDEAQQALTRAYELGETEHQASVDALAADKESRRQVDALLRRAFEAHNGGRRDEALHALRQAIELQPEDPRPRTLEVRLLSELAREAEALPRAEALVAMLPEDPEPLFLRGMVKLGLKDFAGAEADLRRVLEQVPDHLGGLNGLAMALMLSDREDEAVQVLERLLRRWPEDELAQRNLAKLRRAAGDG